MEAEEQEKFEDLERINSKVKEAAELELSHSKSDAYIFEDDEEAEKIKNGEIIDEPTPVYDDS